MRSYESYCCLSADLEGYCLAEGLVFSKHPTKCTELLFKAQVPIHIQIPSSHSDNEKAL